ncbi:hypothetical protein AKL19_12140 [Vibrio parahaemolyticus O4:K55 str. NY3547]|nr:hypothetical protein BBL85_13635 [Vibrio parahaemolyticus]OQK12453.1 hypothetical protein AKL19_12140 [Vibrio parahaemolyticus O4:K55 str. NY3547]
MLHPAISATDKANVVKVKRICLSLYFIPKLPHPEGMDFGFIESFQAGHAFVLESRNVVREVNTLTISERLIVVTCWLENALCKQLLFLTNITSKVKSFSSINRGSVI